MNRNILLWTACVAVILTVIFGTIHVAVQQNERQSANDPQIQMAEDAAAALSAGKSTASVVTSAPSVDLAKSLAPFLIIYDASGKAVAADAILESKIPTPPVGVFTYVEKNGEDRITWQPSTDVRIASVIVRSSGTNPMFVLAGRSLKEVEKREQSLQMQVMFGWVVSMLLVVLAAFFYHRNTGRASRIVLVP